MLFSKSVCSFECCCVYLEGGGGVLFCIKTSGMSITVLIEQNVYCYSTLTDTLSLLFTTHQERYRFTCHLSLKKRRKKKKKRGRKGFKALPLFLLLPSLICLKPQRLEMVMVDTTDRQFLPPPPPSPVCGPLLHRAIDQTHPFTLIIHREYSAKLQTHASDAQ